MFVRFPALLPIAALAALVAAVPSELEARQTSQCNTGSIQCCSQTYVQGDPTLTTILGKLGVTLPDASGLVGLGCTSITVVGPGASSTCTQQPVCCSGNTYNGLINIGCTTININA